MVRRPVLSLSLVILLIFGSVFIVNNFTQKAYTKDNLIRFHVVANSNSKLDQDVKYQVRDALVGMLSKDLANLNNYEEACELVIEKKPEIICKASEVLAQSGLSYPVSMDFGRYSFPARAYGKIILPQGKYQAVKVVLGNGEGANWWCVLFPPLCFVDVSGEDREVVGISKPLMTEKNNNDAYDIRMRFWRILQVPGEHMARLLNI